MIALTANPHPAKTAPGAWKTASGSSGWNPDKHAYRIDPQDLQLRRESWPAATTTASGVSVYGFRYYDPEEGRWLSRDPIGENGGWNVYGFVGNNGVVRIDRLGLLELKVGFSYDRKAIDNNQGPQLEDRSKGVTGANGITQYPPLRDEKGNPQYENRIRKLADGSVSRLRDILRQCSNVTGNTEFSTINVTRESAGPWPDPNLDLTSLGRTGWDTNHKVYNSSGTLLQNNNYDLLVLITDHDEFRSRSTKAETDDDLDGIFVNKGAIGWEETAQFWKPNCKTEGVCNAPWVPFDGFIVLHLEAGYETLAHEFGHYVGWGYKAPGGGQDAHHPESSNLMHHFSGPKPDCQWCERTMNFIKRKR